MTSPIIIENPNSRDHVRKEWLLTNSLGGYAMETVLGINTRRYHGLLVAATNPPVGRIVALHSMIEQLVIPGEDGTEEVIDLSTQMFVGPDGEPMIHPEGWHRLWRVEISQPDRHLMEWRVRGFIIERELTFSQDKNCVRISYSIAKVPGHLKLRLRPTVPLRGFHTIGGPEHPKVVRHGSFLAFESASHRLWLTADAGQWHAGAQWWRNWAYMEDHERGQDWIDDVWSPGYLELKTEQHRTIVMHWDLQWPHHFSSQAAPVARVMGQVVAPLAFAADQFVVRRVAVESRSTSIIAGYPWFSDWGRDAMISLPGLLLCAKRFEEAQSLLLLFASHLRNGLIPNHFDDATGEPHYNTVDASLWFIHAVWQYWMAIRGPLNSALLAACREIVAAYREGTDFEIFMDSSDGLISAGNETTQLTWMDAARDGVVFTPRHGKPVEVNALWFNALHCVAEMTDNSEEARNVRELAERVASSFRAQFWWEPRHCLHDVLVPQCPRTATRGLSGESRFVPDIKLRPNQILAVSLPFSPLFREQQRAVVNIVRARLLTPYGLRTLDQDDPHYRGRFEGALFERDRAYHNGTVWPWLLGPFCEAVLRSNDFSEQSKHEVRSLLQPLVDELSRTTGPGCLGQLAEVYDGDAPQRPGGCVAQAWSVAEIVRILTRIGDRPPTVLSC